MGQEQGEGQGVSQDGRKAGVSQYYGPADEGLEVAPYLATGADQDRAAVEGDQERTHPGDADVPGELGHVPDPGELPGGLPAAAAAEAGLAVQ